MSHPTPPEKIRQLVQEVNSARGSYHKFDVGSNLVLDVEYDMTKYLHHGRAGAGAGDTVFGSRGDTCLP